MKASDDIVFEGVVEEVLGGGNYKVKIDQMDMYVTAYLAGNLKKNNIKVMKLDRVQVKLNEYDPTKGIIIYRFK